jgi:hypothetical protein
MESEKEISRFVLKYLERWVEQISALVPDHARVGVEPHGADYCIALSCRPTEDTQETAKKVNRVNLIITRQALEDYIIDYRPSMRRRSDANLMEFLFDNLKEFQKQKRETPHTVQSEVSWIVTSNILNVL